MGNKILVKTTSAEETKRAGAVLAKTLSPGKVVALFGDLGSGKTVLAKGIAQALGVRDEVTSPTFTILAEYEAENGAVLRHFDMYRITSKEDLFDIGYYESLEPPFITVIEWSENIEDLLPEDAILVRFSKTGDECREIEILVPEGKGGEGA